MTEQDIALHSGLYRPPHPTPAQIKAFDSTRSELQKTRAQMVDVLNATIAEFAQSGLWHLAAEDGALETRLEKKFAELKDLIESLRETTRDLHGQVSRSKRLPYPPRPSMSGLDSDMESGTDEDGRLPRKRRRASPQESTSGLDEDAIEQELLQDDESIQERFASIDARVHSTENMVTECQRDITQEIDDKTSEKLKELTRFVKTRQEERQAVLNADSQTLLSYKSFMEALDKDVTELAGEIANQIHNTSEAWKENAALKAKLDEARRQMAEMSALQKSQVEKSQQEIASLSTQFQELEVRVTAPPPLAQSDSLQPMLQQISQLMQSNGMLSRINQHIREEVIRPALDEHRVKIEETCRTHEALVTERIITKVDKANDVVLAMSKWADKIKKDVDPGLLLPSANAQPTSTPATAPAVAP
ncbi:hypothetical protein EUX98_g4480 [Antrodiella citrinella]|uniref:Uncharacterized protein n=1 Tax=Antrodiella citrinella TaxID=2447956 RepID=A0A4S4MWM2_9APHY|nr:hypothetical protein EUX98_g4480 [Antrodiella citrinella]